MDTHDALTLQSDSVLLPPAYSHLQILFSGLGVPGRDVRDSLRPASLNPGFPDDISVFFPVCHVGWVPSCPFPAAGSW